MKKNATKLRASDVLDEISHQVALAAAENGKSTPAEERWSRELGAKLDARIAELRRNLIPAANPVEKARPIRRSWLALKRDELIAKLKELTEAKGGAVQYAHRDLRGLSDHDLRQLLDLLDTSPRDPD